MRLSAKQRWQIARQNKLLWANVALVVLTAVICANADSTDLWLRAWSLVLQLLGAYIVLRDLSGAAKDFGAAGIIENNKRWFNAVVLGRPTVVSVSADLTLDGAICTAVGEVRVAVDHSAPVEEQLAQLHRYIEAVSNAATQAVVLIDAKERALERKIRDVRQEFESALAAVNGCVKQAMTGNYPMLFFGAWWVAVGTILSTFAPEIPKLLTADWGFSPLPLDNIDLLKFKYLVSVKSIW